MIAPLGFTRPVPWTRPCGLGRMVPGLPRARRGWASWVVLGTGEEVSIGRDKGGGGEWLTGRGGGGRGRSRLRVDGNVYALWNDLARADGTPDGVEGNVASGNGVEGRAVGERDERSPVHLRAYTLLPDPVRRASVYFIFSAPPVLALVIQMGSRICAPH